MTFDEFLQACAEVEVSPNVALEDDEVQAALEDRDDAAVIEALQKNF